MELEETLQIELKEFYLRNFNSKIDSEPYEEYILSGKMYSNSQVLKSLQKDFIKYIPKYLSGWNHSDLEIEHGYLYFGVCDNGNISGIPFNGELKKETIYHMILKTFKYVKGNLSEIKENLKINLIKINPHEIDTLEEYKKIVKKYETDMKNHRKNVEKYLEWLEYTNYWRCKLVDILNESDRKIKFYNWVNKVAIDNREIILKEITDWEYSPIIKQSINKCKNDPSTMIFWLCQYKDIMLARRGIKPLITPIKEINWKKFYHTPRLMNTRFKKLNKDANFYLVKLELPNIKKPIYAYNKNIWKRYYRIENHLGPHSIPL